MSEIILHLVGPESQQSKAIELAGLIGIVLFGFGFLLDKLGYPFGEILEVIAAFFVALIMAVKIINKLRGIPSRIIMSNTVCFQPDRIVIEKRCIEMQSIRVIDATMAYKDGPAYGSAKYLSDGTNNAMRVIYHDSREDTINFYLEFSSQLKMLEQILREGKQRHGFTLIM